MKNNKTNLLNYLIAAIVIVFVINISIISASKNAVKEKIDISNEANRPADLSLTIIKDSACTDCADIVPIIDAIKKTNVQVISEKTYEVASPEAEKIIRDQEIKKLPALMIKGELSKNSDVSILLSRIGEIKNDTFKFTYALAPYLDLATNSVKGKTTVTFISDKTCTECYDINPFNQILANNLGMINPAKIILDKSDKAAQVLIAKYKIESVPMLILSGELTEYPNLTGAWLQIGTLEKDGAWVLREIKKVNAGLIYRDLKTGNIIKPATSQSSAGTSVPVSTPIAK